LNNFLCIVLLLIGLGRGIPQLSAAGSTDAFKLTRSTLPTALEFVFAEHPAREAMIKKRLTSGQKGDARKWRETAFTQGA
jgi:hypothetical protein